MQYSGGFPQIDNTAHESDSALPPVTTTARPCTTVNGKRIWKREYGNWELEIGNWSLVPEAGAMLLGDIRKRNLAVMGDLPALQGFLRGKLPNQRKVNQSG